MKAQILLESGVASRRDSQGKAEEFSAALSAYTEKLEESFSEGSLSFQKIKGSFIKILRYSAHS
jgi:hypothetical protein